MRAPADDIERLRAWTYRRQQLGGAASGPEQALRDVVGVYSSHPTAPLSLLARSAPFDPQRFTALEEHHEAIRLPAMRLSVFLLPTDWRPASSPRHASRWRSVRAICSTPGCLGTTTSG